MVQLGCFHVSMATPSNIFSFIICRDESMHVHSSSKSNVSINTSSKSAQSIVPCRSYVSRYQFLGIVSNVWINPCTHSCCGISFHVVMHRWICSLGSFSPSYFFYISVSTCPNLIHINIWHTCQSPIFFLCVPHHLEGVDLRVVSKANNIWSSGTRSS